MCEAQGRKRELLWAELTCRLVVPSPSVVLADPPYNHTLGPSGRRGSSQTRQSRHQRKAGHLASFFSWGTTSRAFLNNPDRAGVPLNIASSLPTSHLLIVAALAASCKPTHDGSSCAAIQRSPDVARHRRKPHVARRPWITNVGPLLPPAAFPYTHPTRLSLASPTTTPRRLPFVSPRSVVTTRCFSRLPLSSSGTAAMPARSAARRPAAITEAAGPAGLP